MMGEEMIHKEEENSKQTASVPKEVGRLGILEFY